MTMRLQTSRLPTSNQQSTPRSMSSPLDIQGSGHINETSAQTAKSVSQDLKEFYDSHDVDLSSLLSPEDDKVRAFAHRFIRLNPRYDKEETISLLGQELKEEGSPVAVPWLDDAWGFYALPASFKLAASHCFRSGRIYGMDVSSGAGVAALLCSKYDVEKDDNSNSGQKDIRILDLCCCPGLKLCAMADCFAKEKQATVVGVDISENRMALCKKIVQKYHIDTDTCGTIPQTNKATIQLYCQDGTTFGIDCKEQNLVFDSRAAAEEVSTFGQTIFQGLEELDVVDLWEDVPVATSLPS